MHSSNLPQPSGATAKHTKPNKLKPDTQEDGVEAAGEKKGFGIDKENGPSEGVMVHGAVAAERLAQEAVELAPGDPRPWQALAEACDARGRLCDFRFVPHNARWRKLLLDTFATAAGPRLHRSVPKAGSNINLSIKDYEEDTSIGR